MRNYELLFIVDASISDEEKEKVVVGVSELISKVGGKPGEPDKWGVRKFAYPVHYKNEGYYCLINFEAEDTAIAQITGKLNINKYIVRQMIVAK